MPDNGTTRSGFDPADLLTAFWTQWMEQSSRGTQALLEAMQEVGDPIKQRQRWLDATAESLENFMRTPVFLEAMKQQLKAITDLKTMQDQVIKGTARQLGMPLADDITGLFERLNSVEKTILKRLGDIDSRLQAVEAKFTHALEPSQP